MLNIKTQMSSLELPMDELLSYLSQIVLSKTDEETERLHLSLQEEKQKLVNSKKNLRVVKDRLSKVSSENNRLKVLGNVLHIIDSLNKEGILIGNNKTKISRILAGIHDKSLVNLKKLETKLSSYLPDINRFSVL